MYISYIPCSQTTTSSLWILYSLAKNHEVQDKLYKEIENLLPNKEPITPEILSQLSYLKAVVKETFRWDLSLLHRKCQLYVAEDV